jgi:hypothetical protein
MPRVIDEFGRVYNIPAHVLSRATAGTSRGQTPPKIELHIHIHVHVEGAEVTLGGVTREMAMDCGDLGIECGDLGIECGDLGSAGRDVTPADSELPPDKSSRRGKRKRSGRPGRRTGRGR